MNISPNETKTFPSCDASGPTVHARDFIEPKTALAVVFGTIVLVFFALICIVIFYIGIILLIGILVDYFRRKKALAQLKGSAIEINQNQFPEIYSCVQAIAQRLGLNETPVIYLVEGNTINAAAMRLAGRRVVVLIDDLVFACLNSGEPRTLSFIIGHELAHHALGHTGYFRSQLARMMKWLSRLDEFSCDAVANQIVGAPAISAKALTVMLAGPQLMAFVNTNQLIQQAREVEADKNSKKAEKHLTHPLTLRRLIRFV
ncbi:MAG TPA: M48 family metallopeptidase [Verrucomicrobiae bacterium]|jgi:Zn-dependent protease with chaperone function